MSLEKVYLVNARYKCSSRLTFHITRPNSALEILTYFRMFIRYLKTLHSSLVNVSVCIIVIVLLKYMLSVHTFSLILVIKSN